MLKKKKVLHVIGSLRIGGAENVSMNICRYIDKNKFQCDFLLFNDDVGGYEEEARALGAKIIRIPVPSDSYQKYIRNLVSVFIEGEYDIVHSHVLLNNGLVLWAANLANVKKRISHSHSTHGGKELSIMYRSYEAIMKFLNRRYSTQYIACGVEAANYLFNEKNFHKKNGFILNNGINLNKFEFDIDLRHHIRHEINGVNKLVVGHVGRLAEVKNHKFLLEIFSEIKKIRKDAVLLLVGDGELREDLEKQVQRLNLSNDVIITGLRSDVSDILQAIDIFVFPSLFEGLPLTVIEAQASGLKCLVSSTITSEVKVTDLVTFMSLEKTAKDWAEKAIEISDYQRTNYSYQLILSGYDVGTTIKRLEFLYEN